MTQANSRAMRGLSAFTRSDSGAATPLIGLVAAVVAGVALAGVATVGLVSSQSSTPNAPIEEPLVSYDSP